MRRPLAWLLGGFALLGFLRRRKDASAPVADTHGAGDPRADELRRKLVEARSIVEERDEFEAAELTVDIAEPAPDPGTRRRAVHDAAQDTLERMRRR